jgi:hypothetical protein
MDKTIFKTLHERVFSHGKHCSQQNVDKLAWKMLEHGIQNNLPCEIIFHSFMPCGQNSDQTRIHLVPKVGEKTWESKGTKHI